MILSSGSGSPRRMLSPEDEGTTMCQNTRNQPPNKMAPFTQHGTIYLTTWHHIPEDKSSATLL